MPRFLLRLVPLVLVAIALTPPVWADGTKQIRVLIIDGQNNHDWKTTTPHMKKALEACGRFSVEVATTPQKPPLPPEPATVSEADVAKYKEALLKYADAYVAYRNEVFNPDLTNYDVILSNYNV